MTTEQSPTYRTLTSWSTNRLRATLALAADAGHVELADLIRRVLVDRGAFDQPELFPQEVRDEPAVR